ncbi:hypothetical protein G7072_05915 [Nocardioides sp. HDW12B]|uniref:FtsX-like permease family protein n=1 Tax=Nocardioides sp. HDW12B TaxID=2714939 RepID=UPI0014091DE6|nr:FtsX-like permease family protein [Nocardioides sp. HDW12B]QIK65934.1 hypothetical protein G7072_05915 [Nocardioides sp. HDW12B]
MIRTVGTLRLLRRRARAELASLLALALLVTVTAALAATVPRVLSATSDQALRAALADAPDESLEISASTTNDEGVDQLRTVDAQVRGSLTAGLREVVVDSGRGATTGLYDTRDPAGEPVRDKPFTWLQLRHQPGALEQVTWVQGRAPRSPGEDAATRTAEGERVPLLEVALDARLAEQLELEVGKTVTLEPLEVAPLGDGTTAVRVTGLFEPRDASARTWGYAPALTTLGQRYSADGQLVAEYAAALVDGDQLEALRRASPLLRYDWHYPVEPSALAADNAAPVLADLEEVVARGAFVESSSASVTGGADSVALASGLVDLLRGHLDRAQATSALVALVLGGVLLVALAVLALACAVVVRRRASGLVLAHARGASRAALTATSVAEVAVVVAAGSAAGSALAGAAGGDRAAGASALLAALVGVAALVLTGAATWRTLPGRAGSSRVPWRTATEATVLLAAVLAVLEVRRRGLGAEAGTGGGADPVLVLAPVLVVLAVVVLVLRALPPVLRRASAVASGRAGLVPFLALARAARQPLAVALPLSTLLLGLGFAVFASGVTATVDEGQERAAWRDVGADYLLQAEYFEEEDLASLADLPGVDQVVPALRRERATFFDPAGRATDGNVLVVDAAGYADLLARAPGSGADPDAVRRLAEPVDPESPLSALTTTPARTALAADEGAIDPTASLGRTEVAVTATPATFPLDGGLGLVVLDLPSVQERESFPIRPNTLLLRGSPEAAPAIGAAVANLEQRVVVTDRRAVLEDLADSPFVGSTQALFAAGAAAAAAYCLLALTLTLVLAARSRARLASTLRMLGAGPRGLSRLAVLEVAPLLGVMLVAGAAAGLLLVALLLPALDLQPLTGGASAPETRLGLLRTAGLVAGLTALVVATVAGVSAVERRRGLGETLREGDEP